jgi:hypothetical protein
MGQSAPRATLSFANAALNGGLVCACALDWCNANVHANSTNQPTTSGHNVALGRDHTISATCNGRVVLHYDLASRRRYISVDDGSLGHLPSKPEMKAKLVASLDVAKYLRMDGPARLAYVQARIAHMVRVEAVAKVQENKERILSGKARKFHLVDMNDPVLLGLDAGVGRAGAVSSA